MVTHVLFLIILVIDSCLLYFFFWPEQELSRILISQFLKVLLEFGAPTLNSFFHLVRFYHLSFLKRYIEDRMGTFLLMLKGYVFLSFCPYTLLRMMNTHDVECARLPYLLVASLHLRWYRTHPRQFINLYPQVNTYQLSSTNF